MMNRSDIMSNTLDQLIEKFYECPDSFEYRDDERNESIVWQNKVNLADETIKDPNAPQRTVLVTWSEYDKALTVLIINECFTDVDRFLSGAISFDAKLRLSRPLERFRVPNRKFRKLVRLVKKQREHKKTKEFLTKMSTVFPAIIDHFLIGK